MSFRKFIFLFSGLLLTFNAFSQTYQLSGHVFDEDFSEPQDGAYVVLTRLPDSAKAFTVTDVEGKFLFKINNGNYLLEVSSLGFVPLRRSIKIDDAPLNLDTLFLKTESFELEEVKVKGEVSPVIQMGDTTQYNANSYKVNPDANAEDLIRKMPGVVEEGGRLKIQGEEVRQVLVDGKPFFGDDPATVLKNLPAEAIAQIQVYDQQSDQAQFTGLNDGETTKTINIITKPSMRHGMFGRGYAGYGTDNRYRAGGNINSFDGDRRISVIGQVNNINIQNFSSDDLLGVSGGGGGGRGNRSGRGGRGGGGRNAGSDVSDFQVSDRFGVATTQAFGINYSDKFGEKTELTGSYFFNRSENVANQILNRSYVFLSDSVQSYNENILSLSTNTNHKLNFRINHVIDSSNSLLIRPRISIQQNSGTSGLSGQNSLNGLLLNQTGSNFESDLLGYNLSNDILYRHRFAKERRTFSLNIHTGYRRNSGDNQLLAGNSFFDNGEVLDSINQVSDLKTSGYALSARGVFTEPIGKNSQVQIEHMSSIDNNDASKRTFNYSFQEGQYLDLDSTLSNIFKSRYNSQRLGTAYVYSKEKLRFNVKMRYQFAQLTADREFPVTGMMQRNFNNILPSAFLMYNFTKSKNIRLYYRTYTSPPPVEQLQDVVINTNPVKLYQGNPDLVQEYRQNIFLRYTSTQDEGKKSFSAFLGGTIMDNYITNSTYIAERDTFIISDILLQRGAQLIRPINLNGYYNIRTFANYSFPIEKIKSNLNLNATINYTRTPGLVNNLLNYSHSSLYGIGAVLGSNISKNLDFTVSSNSNLNFVENTLRADINTRFFNQSSHLRMNWIFLEDLVFRTDINHQLFTGLTEGFNQNFVLWNMSVGKKIFKSKLGEVSLSVYDLLGQNTSIRRNITEAYFEDVRTNVLQRYVMLNFTYNLRKFGGNG